MKAIKWIFATPLFLVLFGTAIACAQSASDAYRTETFTVSSSPSVEVKTSGGFVEVIGSDSEQVIVEMFVSRRNRYLKESDTDLSNFEIVIEQSGDAVRVEARRRGTLTGRLRGSVNEAISFRVTVPREAVVEGSTSGGRVSATGLLNQVSLTTSGGSVNASDISGSADFKTSGGSIALEKISGSLRAQTSGGSIRASNIEGVAEVTTSGGSITLEKISAKMSARTSGGSIRANLAEFVQDVELRTSGGNVTITIPELENYSLDIRGQRVNTTLQNFSGEMSRDRIRGNIGEGGPLLSARTSGGRVSISH